MSDANGASHLPSPQSADRPPAPQWVATTIGVKGEELATLEVNVQSFKLYEALINYCAQRAVDIGEKAPANVERLHSNPLDEAREWPGRLSSVQYPPDKVREFWRFWDDDDNDSDDDDNSLKSRTYAAGFGWAKLKTNDDNVVLVEHYTRGEPQEEFYKFSMFRVIVLYGADATILKNLCREASDWSKKRDEVMTRARPDKYILYTLKIDKCGDSCDWKCHGHKRSRPMSSIVLTEGLGEDIVNDMGVFLKRETRKWYREHGLPYRRNYLLYGPPGCGKTSIIRSLAGKFKLKASFMSMTHQLMSDQLLVEALAKVPRPSILVFEDVDALFDKRTGKTHSTVTFSGLLNAVDGMISPDGVMMVMTTNHKDKLDAALTRCGRVDRQFEFAPPGRSEIARYFLTYYPDAEKAMAERFADAVMKSEEENAKSIATLQQHFIRCRKDTADDAISIYCEEAEAAKKKRKSSTAAAGRPKRRKAAKDADEANALVAKSDASTGANGNVKRANGRRRSLRTG